MLWLMPIAAWATSTVDTGFAEAAPDRTTVTCGAPILVGTLPADGAVDVPTDVQPLMLFEGAACGVFGFVLFEEVVSGEWFEVPLITADQSGDTRRVRITPPTPLVPASDYRMTLQGDYETSVLTFRTGKGPGTEPPPTAPALTLSIDDASWNGPALEVPYTVAVTGIPQDTLVTVAVGSLDAHFLAPRNGRYEEAATVTVLPGTDLCAFVTVEDALGQQSDLARQCEPIALPPSEQTATSPVPKQGCSTAPGVPGGLALVLLLPLLARRKVSA